MYLFSVEGGDGSGKGLATKIVSEVLNKEFSFSSVEITGEPRREHALGRLAIDSVRKQGSLLRTDWIIPMAGYFLGYWRGMQWSVRGIFTHPWSTKE